MSDKSKKQPVHYVDKEEFTAALTVYSNAVREFSKGEGNGTKPQITNYIGSCVLKIAEGLASRPNFSSYSYKDEMISDGIENVFSYLSNFDAVGQEITKILINFLYELNKTNPEKFLLEMDEAKVNSEWFLTDLDDFINGRITENDMEIYNDNMYPQEVLFEEPFNIKYRLKNITDEEIKKWTDKALKRIHSKKFKLENVNIKKKPNAFAYVTQIVYFAFLRRIDKEKKQQHIKEKSIENSGLLADIVSTQDHDNTQYHNQYLDILQGNLNSDYEEKKNKKKKDKEKENG